MFDGADNIVLPDYKNLRNNPTLNRRSSRKHLPGCSKLAIKVLKFWGFFRAGSGCKIWRMLIHIAMITFILSSVVCPWINEDINYGIFSDCMAGISYYVDWWLCWRLVTNHGLHEEVIESTLNLSVIFFSIMLMLFTLLQDLWYLSSLDYLEYNNNPKTDSLHEAIKLCFSLSNSVVGPFARPCAILISIAAINQLQKKITNQIEKLHIGLEEPHNYRKDIIMIENMARSTTNLVSVIIGQIVLESIFRCFWVLDEWHNLKLTDRVFIVCNLYILAQSTIPVLYGLAQLQSKKEIGMYHLLTDNASYQVVELAKRLPTARIFGFEVTTQKLAKMVYIFLTFAYAILQFSGTLSK